MVYTRKTTDEWQLWVHYGKGWEHEVTEETAADGRRVRKEYRDNTPYPVKLVKRRVKKETA